MILSTALTNLKTAVIMTPYVLDGFNSGTVHRQEVY